MNSKLVMNGPVVLIRGAGEQASGVGWALAKAGFRVVMTEVAEPLMVRWPVCFGTAIEEGRWKVEEITACRIASPTSDCETAWKAGEIPVLVDPDLKTLPELNPSILVDAIMAKRNMGTKQSMAPLTIGLGPGFTAGEDVDVVIETNRGHHLGRIIYSGPAQPNTGIPGEVKGISKERVVYSTKTGVFKAKRAIGEQVLAGDCLGEIEDGIEKTEVVSLINGVLRGLLRTNTQISENVKIGDIDPRGNEEYCWTISEKARAIGAAVLLCILECGIISPLRLKG
ncbi:selenium-dependent molybdenum cofactor biosynthesis protein YqeB [Desulfosporosinus nitroreducens]|uniref:Selenium-dependent molybdenum cofactor biosynthesis protein YqeB n=1 Tax=Desulfosporosinus nitroreducens TaxID=2018668 RepID=A0ABT8QN67_9FIRM|nr:selenium-dependent molybdenum cofactor biosynthesis protein YqeB [Desulfosporosinus nitroreducens]MCO1603947.1 selenium-dependent molybdenum cofactor biosynthesis protein YqeB [Desulfosporosinus nitroreducens]MDO0822565.1 selenium-dependent molybdenum cofactor biosynthesis protein YqeB [Desulfosporosinus nitroreducens]